LAAEQCACVGDDLPDLPLLQRAGLAVAVADAQPAIKQAAHYVTTAHGGRGAAREVCDLILAAQGRP
jgi:3-deoxy-D-manno-octulosonate 8-phosphate phosphatase (KDO 8-P phosphatase)